MLYGLSPPAKRKYSNLKQLVGWQIVKRNRKKTPQRVSPRGDEQLQRKGISKGACQLAKVTLRDNMHTGIVRDVSMNPRHRSRVGAVRHTHTHTRVVSAFFHHGNSCVDTHKIGWVGARGAAVVQHTLQGWAIWGRV